jgi:hypothetical protein
MTPKVQSIKGKTENGTSLNFKTIALQKSPLRG